MTMATISTLGMKPDRQADINPGEQILIIFLIIIGIVAAMIALSMLVSMVVEGQIRGILGRRKVDKKIASLRGHIIVCGYGRTGQTVCQFLKSENIEPVIIEMDNQKTALAENNDLPYILGDAGEESSLLAAGIERASGLIATLDTDASNVFVSLVARDLNRKIKIVARAEKPESKSRLIRAGANHVICAQEIGANRMANILIRPGIVNFVDFATHGLELEAEQRTIEPGNALEGMKLRDANLPREMGIIVIAIKRNDNTIFNPHPDTILQSHDAIFITGKAGSIAQFEEKYC